MLVKSLRRVVFRVNHHCPHASYVGRVQDAAYRIDEKGRAKSLSLPGIIDGEARQNDDGNGKAWQSLGQSFRNIFIRHLTDDKRMKADNLDASRRDISLRASHALTLERILLQ